MLNIGSSCADVMVFRGYPVKIRLCADVVESRIISFLPHHFSNVQRVTMPYKPFLVPQTDIRIGACIVYNGVKMKVIREILLPVQAGKDVSPAGIDVVSGVSRMAYTFPIPHLQFFILISYLVCPGIEIHRQSAVFVEKMSHGGIEVSHCKLYFAGISIWQCKVGDKIVRNSEDIKPCAPYAHIERGLSRNDRTLELKTSVEKAYIEGSAVLMEIARSCGDVHYRRSLTAKAGGEAALVEIKIVDHLRVE